MASFRFSEITFFGMLSPTNVEIIYFFKTFGPLKDQYSMAAYTEDRRVVLFSTIYDNESNLLLMTIGRNDGSKFFMVSS